MDAARTAFFRGLIAGGRSHIMPVCVAGDTPLPEHKESRFCWCSPQLAFEDYYTGDRVWQHSDDRLNLFSGPMLKGLGVPGRGEGPVS